MGNVYGQIPQIPVKQWYVQIVPIAAPLLDQISVDCVWFNRMYRSYL
jgi:hypothetical protein